MALSTIAHSLMKGIDFFQYFYQFVLIVKEKSRNPSLDRVPKKKKDKCDFFNRCRLGDIVHVVFSFPLLL